MFISHTNIEQQMPLDKWRTAWPGLVWSGPQRVLTMNGVVRCVPMIFEFFRGTHHKMLNASWIACATNRKLTRQTAAAWWCAHWMNEKVSNTCDDDDTHECGVDFWEPSIWSVTSSLPFFFASFHSAHRWLAGSHSKRALTCFFFLILFFVFMCRLLLVCVATQLTHKRLWYSFVICAAH